MSYYVNSNLLMENKQMNNCYLHENHEAQKECAVCRKPICKECETKFKDEICVCPVCEKNKLDKDKKNYLLIILLTCAGFLAVLAYVVFFIISIATGKAVETIGIVCISLIVVVGGGLLTWILIFSIKLYKYVVKRISIAENYEKNKLLEQEKTN